MGASTQTFGERPTAARSTNDAALAAAPAAAQQRSPCRWSRSPSDLDTVGPSAACSQCGVVGMAPSPGGLPSTAWPVRPRTRPGRSAGPHGRGCLRQSAVMAGSPPPGEDGAPRAPYVAARRGAGRRSHLPEVLAVFDSWLDRLRRTASRCARLGADAPGAFAAYMTLTSFAGMAWLEPMLTLNGPARSSASPRLRGRSSARARPRHPGRGSKPVAPAADQVDEALGHADVFVSPTMPTFCACWMARHRAPSHPLATRTPTAGL